MKTLRFPLAIFSAIVLALSPTIASASVVYGTIVVYISGTFKTPVAGTTVKCSGSVFLAPDTSSSPSIASLSAALLFNGGVNSASAAGNVPNVNQFTCLVNVPYVFNNAVANQQLVIAYALEKTEFGKITGRSYQVAKIQNIPGNGVTTTLSLAGYL